MLPIAAVMHKTSINGIFEQAFGRHACGLLGNISFGLCHFIFARELQTSMPAYHPRFRKSCVVERNRRTDLQFKGAST